MTSLKLSLVSFQVCRILHPPLAFMLGKHFIWADTVCLEIYPFANHHRPPQTAWKWEFLLIGLPLTCSLRSKFNNCILLPTPYPCCQPEMTSFASLPVHMKKESCLKSLILFSRSICSATVFLPRGQFLLCPKWWWEWSAGRCIVSTIHIVPIYPNQLVLPGGGNINKGCNVSSFDTIMDFRRL